ncbi:MAG: polyhydroxyalkanoate synthesis regulator DNA-binding domain-containing protein [Myxococcota bacterium]
MSTQRLEPETPQKVIKRYTNRKLYDTARSRYVTLDEIARMVRAGEDVRIIDNESKEDLTSVTLTQIIYEQEKASRRMPLEMLRGMIQTSGETLNELQKSVNTSMTELRQSALSLREAASKQLIDLTESARRFFSREERRAEEFRRTVWAQLDELENRMTDRIHQVRATRAALDAHAERQDGPRESIDVDQLLENNTHTFEHVDGLRRRLAALAILTDRLEASARTSSGTEFDEDDA